jgi:hypothetical protein
VNNAGSCTPYFRDDEFEEALADALHCLNYDELFPAPKVARHVEKFDFS